MDLILLKRILQVFRRRSEQFFVKSFVEWVSCNRRRSYIDNDKAGTLIYVIDKKHIFESSYYVESYF
jgi:hypothetical protein